jgi:hypothetical protein
MDPCSAIPVDKCAQNASCEVTIPCRCNGSGATPVCVGKGTASPCPACSSCGQLTEAECKLNSACRADYCSVCGCGTPAFARCVDANAPPSVCPLKCPAGICCAGRDESSCKADASCTPNYCVGCNGVQSFAGCTGPGDPAATCNNNCGCRGQADCSNGGQCVAPGGSTCGEACQVSCSSDSACTTGYVCDAAPCACSGGKACIPSCLTGGCATGESCGSDGHCTPTTCSSSTSCPAFFDCVVLHGGALVCERRACTTDATCDGGYCVDGGCYATLGSCQLSP